MRKLILGLLFASCAWPAAALGPGLVAPERSCACNAAGNDRLENPSRFNFGAFVGRCIDSCRYRRSELLRRDGGETLLVSNFKHEGRYWKARIPLRAARAADVGFEEFRAGIFHVFLMFHFDERHPVVLFPQEGDAGVRRVFELVISPEGIPPKRGKYNFFDAYMGRYLTGVRLLSKEEFGDRSIRKLKHKVTLYGLEMPAPKVPELLSAGLQAIHRASFTEVYGLLSNNCATKTLDLIDRVVKPDVAAYPFYYRLLYPLERALPIAGPFGTLNVILSRQLVRGEPKALL